MATNPTLVFTAGWDPFQVLINITTFSRATHVAIGLGPDLLHAYEPGVKLDSRQWWFNKKHQRLVAEYEILPDISPGLYECLAHLGEPYDTVGVLRTAAKIILQRMQSPIQTTGSAAALSHTCASFVTLLDPYGERIPEWRNLDRGTVTPADLISRCLGPSFRPMHPYHAL